MTSDYGERLDARNRSTTQTPAHGQLDVFFECLPDGGRFVRFCPRGVLSKEAVLSKLLFIDAEPGLGAQTPALWDFRGFDFNPYDLATCRRQLLSLANLPQRKGAFRAFVVDSELGYGTIRMMQEVLSGHGIEDMENLHVTYSFDEAKEWIAAQVLASQ